MAYRWQRSRGVDFEHAKGPPGVEDVAEVCFCFAVAAMGGRDVGFEVDLMG